MGRPSVTQVEKNHGNSGGTPLSPLERKLLGWGFKLEKMTVGVRIFSGTSK